MLRRIAVGVLAVALALCGVRAPAKAAILAASCIASSGTTCVFGSAPKAGDLVSITISIQQASAAATTILDSNSVALTQELTTCVSSANCVMVYDYTVVGTPTATYTVSKTIARAQGVDSAVAVLAGATYNGANFAGTTSSATTTTLAGVTRNSLQTCVADLTANTGGVTLAMSNGTAVVLIANHAAYAYATSSASSTCTYTPGTNNTNPSVMYAQYPLTTSLKIVSHDTWTCASGTTCNHTITLPLLGDVLIFTATGIDGTPGNGNVWRAVNGNCGGTQGWGAQRDLIDAGTSTFSVSIDVITTAIAAPSTTCNVSTTGDSLTGSVHVFDITGTSNTNIPGGSFFQAPSITAPWGSNTSSHATSNVTPNVAGYYPLCAFGVTVSGVSPSFTGGSLTWTSFLDDSATGSNDDGFAGPYTSVTPFACTYNYTGSLNTGGILLLLIPASNPSAPSTINPVKWIGA